MARVSVREKIVAAGLDALHRRGFNGCGVEEITRAAGVPKGSFYNHFESKEAFGIEALERYWHTAAARLGMLDDQTLPPVERLRRYFDSLADLLACWDYQKGCMIANFSTELADQSREVRDRLSVIWAEWTRAIEGCVREAQGAGRARSDLDPATIAAFLVKAWEGAVLRAKVNKDSQALDQFRQVVFTTIFH